ncbi:MAG: radical SAM protein [Parcubacteria group bacterium]
MNNVCEPKIKVIIMANSRCNAKCKHCYVSYDSERSPQNLLQTVISLQNQDYGVTIAGSEILLEPNYLKAYKQAGQTRLLTNGLILKKKPELYDILQNYGIKQFTFSLNFDVEQSLRSVPESFIADRVRESKQRGFKVQVTTLVVPENVDSINRMCERAVRYGVNILQFNRFVKLGHDKRMNDYVLSDEQILRFCDHINKMRQRFPEEQLVIKPHANFGPRPGSRGEKLALENLFCPAGITVLALDADDNIYGCPFTMCKNAIVGRYDNNKIVINKVLLGDKRNTCIAHLLSDKKKVGK